MKKKIKLKIKRYAFIIINLYIFQLNCWHIFSFVLECPYLKILNYKMLFKGVDFMLFLGILFGFTFSSLPYFIKESLLKENIPVIIKL